MIHGTVLHVEDDPGVSQFVRKALRSFTIESAPNGLEAMKALEAEPNRFRLVILDLVLPVMNGLEVFAALRRRPETAALPVLVTTGSFVTPNEFAGDALVTVLKKPFHVDQLRVAIDQLLLRMPVASPTGTATGSKTISRIRAAFGKG
jgi:DNA-binding response OmpR family regulator